MPHSLTQASFDEILFWQVRLLRREICAIHALLLADAVTYLLAHYLFAPWGKQALAKFLTEEYGPALRNATVGVKLTARQKLGLGLKTAGTVLKLLYSFVWQEEAFKGDYLTDPKANELGGAALPYVNLVADALTGFPKGPSGEVYPGDEHCRSHSPMAPHAKWHEESAQGLLDLVRLADHVDGLLRQRLRRDDSTWARFWGAVW